MLRAGYFSSQRELLVDGRRRDYDQFAAAVRQAFVSAGHIALPVASAGDTPVSRFVVRAGTPPNRVSYEGGDVIFFLAPSLEKQFLSFIQFPADSELPDSPIQYHHHYDGVADDGTHVAPDSLPVVFTLERV
jgi:hypothetical protein